MKKILWVSDFDTRGSGYFNISSNLCQGLAEIGHEVKALGLAYHGEEHEFDFGIIPVRSFGEIPHMISNLQVLWEPDVMVVALDTHHQEPLVYQTTHLGIPYVGIMPVEADPLCFSWSMVMQQMSKVFIISDFGTKQAVAAGVQAEHLVVGVDTDFWRPAEKEEKESILETLGLQDRFVVLTVADNQERKNLSKAMDIIASYKEIDPSVFWMLVTREHAAIGWKLRDYADEVGITENIMIFERGIPEEQIRDLFFAADAFLLTSKAEGLGMPILEALACEVPVVATACTSINDHLKHSGYGIKYEYKYRDPFGNGWRYFAQTESGVDGLSAVRRPSAELKSIRGREYIKSREWEKSIEVLDAAIREITND
jgi:glycosyltransferase involved in cell wall biosynthesis